MGSSPIGVTSYRKAAQWAAFCLTIVSRGTNPWNGFDDEQFNQAGMHVYVPAQKEISIAKAR
ncbi:MAG TPA: hypothetical protein DCY07_04010 [Rhodospirillaceae bacterium]|nr:hypothetical protein [Rhodospirillaceae bacterium]